MAEAGFLIPALCTVADAGDMNITAIQAAAANGGDADFVVGLIVGACLGFLIGPALRSWLSYREWAEASRQERLVDQLVTRMESDGERDDEEAPPDPDQTSRRSWQTLP
jgi:ADP-ribosylglycohydrolase